MRIADLVENLAEVVRGLHELYLANLSHEMNEVMRLLTIMATIFIPLSFLAGVWGMNFNPDASPWNMPELNARFGYPVAILAMLATGGGMLWMFRRRGWL
jgi:magnesium transporter